MFNIHTLFHLNIMVYLIFFNKIKFYKKKIVHKVLPVWIVLLYYIKVLQIHFYFKKIINIGCEWCLNNGTCNNQTGCNINSNNQCPSNILY